MANMESSDAQELVELLETAGIEVWLNGGWGVDALLGHQTRQHDDLDITISAIDRAAYADLNSNAGGKRWHLAALRGTPRIRAAVFERTAPIC